MTRPVFIVPEAFEWEERASCRALDPELFFPEHGNQSTDKAKAVCRSCVVQAECLTSALERDDRYGIYGGLTEKERRALKRRAG